VNMEPNPENILEIYRRATVEQYQEGINWYPSTREFARSLDKNVNRAAGVIAALSPQCNWGRNKALAIRAYRDGFASGHTGTQCNKVNAILAGADPEIVLNGKKTTNFYRNIIDPYSHFVTVDGHSFDVAVGMKTGEWARKSLQRKGVYERFSDAYTEVASLFNMPVASMQAVTWVAWRDIYDIKARLADGHS
jgi:hypothetical protein